MSDEVDDFVLLGPRAQRAIDAVFDLFCTVPQSIEQEDRPVAGRRRSERLRPGPRKRRRIDDGTTESEYSTPGGFVNELPANLAQPGGFDAPAAGGFLMDELPPVGGFIVEPPAAGGFVVEDMMNVDALPPVVAGGFVIPSATSAHATKRRSRSALDHPDTQLLLSNLPSALQLLDLPPADPDVLAIFGNAARGWGKGDVGADDAGVRRTDWRAVCAVLLAARVDGDIPHVAGANDDGAQDEETGSGYAEDSEPGEEPGSDGYLDEDGSELSDEVIASEESGDDAEYGTKGKKSGKKATKRRKGAVSEEDGPIELTARQRRSARTAFALFFLDVADDALDAQRIRIRDVSRVAALLKEKITTDEVR